MTNKQNLRRVKKIIRNELGLLYEDVREDGLSIDDKNLRRMRSRYKY